MNRPRPSLFAQPSIALTVELMLPRRRDLAPAAASSRVDSPPDPPCHSTPTSRWSSNNARPRLASIGFRDAHDPTPDRIPATLEYPIIAVFESLHLLQRTRNLAKRLARWTLPVAVSGRLEARWRGDEYTPPPGRIRLGSLQRLRPISRSWGFDRGLPIDRYYIERFLSTHARDIRGRVLEVKDNHYTLRFGRDHVTESDVVNVTNGTPLTTIVADLTSAECIESDSFDCIILTQTLHLIYDAPAALRTLYRILRPGGVLLLTVPGISQIARDPANGWHDCWRFTAYSTQRLLEDVFAAGNVDVQASGNVLASTAFLHGLAAQELATEQLDYRDDDYQMLITARAVKA